MKFEKIGKRKRKKKNWKKKRKKEKKRKVFLHKKNRYEANCSRNLPDWGAFYRLYVFVRMDTRGLDKGMNN